MQLNNFYRNQKGQTLIETIVAVGIMIMGITAILSLTIATLSVSGMSKEKIVAMNLAREGIEITRAIRDTNWLRNDLCWENNSCGLTNGEWRVDWTTEFLSAVPTYESGECTNCQLKIDSNGLYNLSSGSPTVYNRMVVIDDVIGEVAEKKIVSKVWWQEHGRTKTVELESRLTNWR